MPCAARDAAERFLRPSKPCRVHGSLPTGDPISWLRLAPAREGPAVAAFLMCELRRRELPTVSWSRERKSSGRDFAGFPNGISMVAPCARMVNTRFAVSSVRVPGRWIRCTAFIAKQLRRNSCFTLFSAAKIRCGCIVASLDYPRAPIQAGCVSMVRSQKEA